METKCDSLASDTAPVSKYLRPIVAADGLCCVVVVVMKVTKPLIMKTNKRA